MRQVAACRVHPVGRGDLGPLQVAQRGARSAAYSG